MRKRSYFIIIRISQGKIRFVFPIPIFLASTAIRLTGFFFHLLRKDKNNPDHFLADPEAIKSLRQMIKLIRKYPPFVFVEVQNEEGSIQIKTK